MVLENKKDISKTGRRDHSSRDYESKLRGLWSSKRWTRVCRQVAWFILVSNPEVSGVEYRERPYKCAWRVPYLWGSQRICPCRKSNVPLASRPMQVPPMSFCPLWCARQGACWVLSWILTQSCFLGWLPESKQPHPHPQVAAWPQWGVPNTRAKTAFLMTPALECWCFLRFIGRHWGS